MQPISVVIADAQPIFREGLRCLLANVPEVHVAGVASTSREAVDIADAANANLLLLDLALSGHSSLPVLREVSRRKLGCHVVILASLIDEPQSIEVLQKGARGILLKTVDLAMLVNCLSAVTAGQYWIGRGAVGSVVAALRRVRQPRAKSFRFGLTPREAQVVNAVATGATNRHVAAALNISEPTVKQHLVSALKKCGVKNRTELALFAVRHRITS